MPIWRRLAVPLSGPAGEVCRLWATPLYGIAEANPFRRGLKAVDPLFDKLCVDFGFCLSQEKIAELSARAEWTAAELADAVFLAEGLDPERGDRDLWRQVRDLIQAFGPEA